MVKLSVRDDSGEVQIKADYKREEETAARR